MWGLRVAAVSLVLPLAACGGARVDSAAWQSALKAQGVSVADWPTYQKTWLDVCGSGDSEMQAFIAQDMDSGATEQVIRVNVANACPDRSDQVDAVVLATHAVDQACATPKSQRTNTQELMAEGMDC